MSLLSIHIKQAGYEPNETKVADVQFSIGQGELVGLIGANGAGKSTTIKSILGLMPFFEGEIVKEEEMSISYLPEQPIFYDECTLQEHIDFVAAIVVVPPILFKVLILIGFSFFIRSWMISLWDQVIFSHPISKKYETKPAFYHARQKVSLYSSVPPVCFLLILLVVNIV